MKRQRWIGAEPWERSKDSIDGKPSFNDRRNSDSQNMDDLIHWLEYANTGYPAARQSVEQEEFWAQLVRNLLMKDVIEHLIFFEEKFEFVCKECGIKCKGFISSDRNDVIFQCYITEKCDCITKRESDIRNYILWMSNP